MRIGLVSYWFNRGQATVGRHLRSAFEQLGHDTFVLAPPDDPPCPPSPDPPAPALPRIVTSLPAPPRPGPFTASMSSPQRFPVIPPLEVAMRRRPTHAGPNAAVTKAATRPVASRIRFDLVKAPRSYTGMAPRSHN